MTERSGRAGAKPLDDRISELYYTAAEARAALGMNRDMFNYWVRAGKIKKRSLMGGKHGLYAKKDIDALAAKLEATMLADTPTLTFRRATADDLDAETYLAYQVFGQAANVPEIRAARSAYIEVCPDSFWHLYDNDKLVAFMNIVPLSDTAMDEFRAGRRGWTFPLSELRSFAPGTSVQCIIIDFVTTPTVPPVKREGYAGRMLLELSHILTGWGYLGIEITKVCAASATPSGQHILNTAGFEVIGDSGKGRLIYELDTLRSTRRILKEYKEALATWKKEQSDSQV